MDKENKAYVTCQYFHFVCVSHVFVLNCLFVVCIIVMIIISACCNVYTRAIFKLLSKNVFIQFRCVFNQYTYFNSDLILQKHSQCIFVAWSLQRKKKWFDVSLQKYTLCIFVAWFAKIHSCVFVGWHYFSSWHNKPTSTFK